MGKAVDNNGLLAFGTKLIQKLKTWTWLTGQLGGKADKVSGATNGHLAGVDSNGNLTDSGYAPGSFATAAQGAKADAAMRTSALNPYSASFDANSLFTENVIYTCADTSATLTNFPVSSAPGGFALINVPHGSYGFQFCELYGDANQVYFRNMTYNASTGAPVFQAWKHFAFTDSNVASATNPKSELKTNQEFVFRKTNVTWDAKSGVIKKIKGKTVAWNQWQPGFNDTIAANGITQSGDGSGKITVTVSSATGYNQIQLPVFDAVEGHIYLCRGWDYTTYRVEVYNSYFFTNSANSGPWIRVANMSGSCSLACFVPASMPDGTYYLYPQIIDLTLLFNGNVPANYTVADFERDYPELYYPYCAGELSSNDAEAVETTGVNLLDGNAREPHYYVSYGNGTLVPENMYDASPFVPVIPGQTYYCHLGDNSGGYGAFYDKDKNFLIGKSDFPSEGTFTAPSGAAYMRVTLLNDHIDEQINISNSAINGQYFPYKKSRINLGLKNIKVKSPNIWDEEAEYGGIGSSDGTNTDSSTTQRTKNFVSVQPGTTYYLKSAQTCYFRFYRKDKSYIGYQDKNGANYTYNNTFVTPDDCYYFRFVCDTAIAAKSITINKSDVAFNGKYFPYGILTIEEGLKSTDVVCDEIIGTKLYKRIGRKDLSTLSWTKYGEYHGYNSNAAGLSDSAGGKAGIAARLVCSKYVGSDPNGIGAMKNGCVYYDGYVTSLNITDYTKDSMTAEQFTESLSGVYLDYELAHEEVYELAEPLPSVYPCDQFGTERVISPVSVTPSAPFCADIQYGAKSDDVADDLITVQKKLVSGTNIKTINNSSLLGSGNLDLSSYEEITYASLKSKRDNSQLMPGRWYRITDYVATVGGGDTANASSANHPFDIIVVADAPNKLNENARAALHSGDTYFANSKLEAWKLKYCIDNDTTRFEWADGTNGKGVVYRMIDEWGNDAPFDFKGIWFNRRRVDVASGNKLTLINLYDLYNDYYGEPEPAEQCQRDYDDFKDSTITSHFFTLGTSGIREVGEDGGDLDQFFYDNGYSDGDQYIVLSETEDYGPALVAWITSGYSRNFYLFTADNIPVNKDIAQSSIVDASLNGSNSYKVNNNVIAEQFRSKKHWLAGNVFIANYCYSNIFGNDCYYNTVGTSCYYNTFGTGCFHNTFGTGCYYNTFGASCYSNTFGVFYYSNTFGNECSYNTFGNYCNSNTFGNECSYNTFGNNCGYNTFENNCYSNAFGNSCGYNTFGNSCGYNTFGNDCYYNTVGNSCSHNTFGNDCSRIRFGSSSGKKSYYRYIIVENGNQYIYLDCSATTSSSNYYQNVLIGEGVNNTSTWKTITDSNVGQTYKTTYQAAASQTINV